MSKMFHVPETTVKAVRDNHPAEWQGALDSLPNERSKRTGRRMFSDDDTVRLATLALLVDKGMYDDDRFLKEDHDAVTA